MSAVRENEPDNIPQEKWEEAFAWAANNKKPYLAGATHTARGDKLRRRDLGRRRSATGLYSFARPDLACRADKKLDLIID